MVDNFGVAILLTSVLPALFGSVGDYNTDLILWTILHDVCLGLETICCVVFKRKCASNCDKLSPSPLSADQS